MTKKYYISKCSCEWYSPTHKYRHVMIIERLAENNTMLFFELIGIDWTESEVQQCIKALLLQLQMAI